jgi:excisionase family DNA binding protein
MGEVQERLYSAKETIIILGISRPTLSRLLRKKAIGHFRIGTRTLFSSEHIRVFLKNVEQLPKAPRDSR